MAVAQRQRLEPLRWLRESVGRPRLAAVHVRRREQAWKTEEEIAAAVLAALNDGATAFLYLRRFLGLDAAMLGRVLGALAVCGLVESVGFPVRWRLIDRRNGTHGP